MITFEHITKTYPRSDKPAVHDLNFHIPEGETCVFIGPSGCGKTTTLKMINRLIEPTEGIIRIGKENILEKDPILLRRGIGYVIQQIGLFPHMTIHENIAVVPRLLGWESSRISGRTDELLQMVGMDPGTYRSRYPRELSGGQRQRVGVARALAADPPIMLMDEPFGAIDPITRDRLQNEFLRLQKRLKKTIAFVTHDIDEAIKMGTLICILDVGGILQQFASPTEILSNPANEFVANFVGADRGLKQLNLVRVGEVMRTEIHTVLAEDDTEIAVEKMRKQKRDTLWVVDGHGTLLGYITLECAQTNPNQKVKTCFRPPMGMTEAEATMKDAFSEMLTCGARYLPVVESGDRLIGIVSTADARALIEDGDENNNSSSSSSA